MEVILLIVILLTAVLQATATPQNIETAVEVCVKDALQEEDDTCIRCVPCPSKEDEEFLNDICDNAYIDCKHWCESSVYWDDHVLDQHLFDVFKSSCHYSSPVIVGKRDETIKHVDSHDQSNEIKQQIQSDSESDDKTKAADRLVIIISTCIGLVVFGIVIFCIVLKVSGQRRGNAQMPQSQDGRQERERLNQERNTRQKQESFHPGRSVRQKEERLNPGRITWQEQDHPNPNNSSTNDLSDKFKGKEEEDVKQACNNQSPTDDLSEDTSFIGKCRAVLQDPGIQELFAGNIDMEEVLNHMPKILNDDDSEQLKAIAVNKGKRAACRFCISCLLQSSDKDWPQLLVSGLQRANYKMIAELLLEKEPLFQSNSCDDIIERETTL